VLSASGDTLAAAVPPPAERSTQLDERDLDNRLEQLTRDILSKEIDFDRWYTQYKLVATHEPRWRHLRYFFMQDSAAALYLASQTEGLCDTAGGLHNPERVTTHGLRSASELGLVGSVLEGTSSAFELGSNALLAMKNKRLGRNPEAARKIAFQRLQEIDRLLKERYQLVEMTKGKSNSVVYESETKLLKYFRDWGAFDFADIYAEVKAYQSSSNVYYAFDVVGSTGYFASYLLGLKGCTDERYNGPSYISAIFADGVFLPAAQAYSYAYKHFYKYWHERLSRQLHERFYDAQPQAKESLHQLELDAGVAKGGTAQATTQATSQNLSDSLRIRLAKRISVYEHWSKRYDRLAAKRQIDVKRAEEVARQSELSGPAIAGPFLAADIMGVDATYHLAHNRKASNASAFAGFIPTTLASVADLGQTSALFYGDLVHNRNLKNQNALPEELLHQQLRTLDELDAILNSKPSLN